ncbi:MAG: acyl-CoA carboxylase subunit beta, partial [Ignavibacterium sp.]|nr:acyl-CoA carboxylase subunit beta [Ignavibacterium sp.]
MKNIGTEIKESEASLKREDFQKELLRKIEAIKDKVKDGGGKIAIEKHKAKGKLTARERIAKLVDNPKDFFELSTLAAYGMYEEYGGAPSSGTIYGIGKIHNRLCVIVANDATVKAGAWFPIT